MILIVEDHADKARIIERLVLEMTVGVDVAIAPTLDDYVREIEEGPSAVITDWGFPIDRGSPIATSDAGRAVVAGCTWAGLPFLVVSGSAPPDPEIADRWVTTGGDPSELRRAIRRLLAEAGLVEEVRS